jgi:hypothetical protein
MAHAGPRAGEPLEEFTAADNDLLAGMFAAKIGDIARRYQEGCLPDFCECFLGRIVRLVSGAPYPNPRP